MGNLDQLFGSVFGEMAAAGQVPGVNPAVTVTMPGMPAFIQGVNDFIQVRKQQFSIKHVYLIRFYDSTIYINLYIYMLN